MSNLLDLPDDVFGEILKSLDLGERFLSFGLASRRCLALAFSSPLDSVDLRSHNATDSDFKKHKENNVSDISHQESRFVRAHIEAMYGLAASLSSTSPATSADDSSREFARLLDAFFKTNPYYSKINRGLEVANIPISGVGVLADLFPSLESLTVENLHLHVGQGKAILEALKNSNENIIKPIQEPRNLFDPSLFEPLFKLKKLKALHVVSIQAPFFSFPFQNLESLNLNVFQSQSKYDLSSRSGVSPLLKEELAKCVNLVSLQLSFCIDFSRLVNLKSLTVSILEPSDIEKIEKIPSRALERLSLAFYNEEAYNMSDHAKRFPNLNGFADSLIELIVSKNPPIPRNCLSELRLKTVRIWKGHADLVTAISDSSLSIESLLLYFASQSREIRLGDFDLIAKMVNLTSFCFYGQIPFGALSVILHNCQHLIQFELDQFGAEVVLSDEEVAVIITFLNKETLTQLTLNSTRVNSNAMEAIASFPKLESLSVSVDCGQTVSDSWLCPLSKLEGLHTFDLHVHSFLDVDEPNRSFVNREFITLNGFHKAFGNSKKLDFLSVTEATQDIDAADVLKFLPPKAMAYIDNFRSS